MKRILVASDLSKRSRRALRRAVALARQLGGELVVLHVADDDRPPALIAAESRAAAAAIRDHLDAAGAEGLRPEPIIVTRAGSPFRVIAVEADRIDADLIVMGAHRKRLLGDVFVGTTVERVMRLGSRPVLMVNRDSAKPYRRVLAAVDLSGTSARALGVARALGLAVRAAVVHGFVPLAEGLMYYADVDRSRIEGHVATNARQARAGLRAFLRDNGLDDMAETLLVEKGGPYEAIESAVRKTGPDLVVVGTRGLGGAKRILLGSVADQVLRRIGCDILAVPPPPDTPPRRASKEKPSRERR